MSATNSTPIINLPLFIGTDKPAWLTDWNGAMNIIDAAIAALQTAEAGTATSLASLAQSVEALSGTVGQHTTALQTLTSAVSGNTGNINTINSLIGNGTPTTNDKTLIGAINEIYGDIGGDDGLNADIVNYDNTQSNLQATDVQTAIDEVNAKIPESGAVEADDVGYNNTQSGLQATDVQAAIDELAQGGAGAKTLRATSTAGGTWVAQLTELAAVFNNLTAEEKANAHVVRTSNGSVFRPVSTSGASMITLGADNTGILGISISLTAKTALSFTGSNGTDVSSTALTGSLQLYA